MVAEFFEVDVRTIDNYLSENEDELKYNGYILCKGKLLNDFKVQFAHEMAFASKTTQLGLDKILDFVKNATIILSLKTN